MKLILEESDLKPEYKDNRAAQENASFDMFNENALSALRLMGGARFVSNDGKIQIVVIGPR